MTTRVLDGASPTDPPECEDTLRDEGDGGTHVAIDDVQVGVVCTHCWQVHPDPDHGDCPVCGVPPPVQGWPAMPFHLNERYQLNRLLGRGGMGAVFLAADLSDGVDADGHAPSRAIKLVQRTAASNAKTLSAMFEHEVAAAGLLGRCTSFVKIYGYETGSRPLLVMEPIKWPTLAKYLKGGALSSRAAATLGIAMLEAVEVMHFYRVVHLDLKPSNMFVEAKETSFRIKVADLGIWARDHDQAVPEALRRSSKTIEGTPGYMSPEQMLGADLGCRSDLHTVGSILWRCVAGQVPYPPVGDTVIDQIMARREAVRVIPPRPPEMSEELYAVLARALAYDAEDRPVDARNMIESLRHIQHGSTWVAEVHVAIDNLVHRIGDLRQSAEDSPSELAQLESVLRGLMALRATVGSDGPVSRRAADRLLAAARRDIAELTDRISDIYVRQVRDDTISNAGDLAATVQVSTPTSGPAPDDTAAADIADEWIDPAARYEIAGLVGVGGAARVYEAHHRILGRRVALRIMCSANIAELGVSEERTFFFAMSHAAALIEHPNVARVYDYGVGTDGVPYAVMEYLDGETLFEHLRARRFLPEREALTILESIASGLVAAHEVGVLHRNLKLARVALRPMAGMGICPTLYGFGFEKQDADRLLPKGRYFGTPQYMSPEQASRSDVAFPADVYALGTIAFRLLTGTYPFWGGVARAVLKAKRNQDAPPLPAQNPVGEPLSGDLRAWVAGTLQRTPGARPDAIAALDGLRALR
jgi:serine/threonine protein kinase